MRYNNEEAEYVKANYANMPTKDIAKRLNRTEKSIYQFAFYHGLKKSDEYLNSELCERFQTGTDKNKSTQFKIGQIPHNKGKKMPDEFKEKIKHTWFKPGHKPKNTRQDRFSVRSYHAGTKYIFYKVADSNWVPLHRYLYEKHYGPIPKGYNIIFADGNNTNFNLDNLKIVSNAELMKLNTIQRYPVELNKLIRANSKLRKQIDKLLNEENNG